MTSPLASIPSRVEPVALYQYTAPAFPETERRVKCPYCGHLLFKGEMTGGTAIEIKCQCKRLVKFYVAPAVS